MKRNAKAIDILRGYICRNSQEQDVPPGFMSKQDVKDMLGCSENQFNRLMKQLKENKGVESKYIKRVKGSRIYKCAYFRFSNELSRLIKSK
jgi:CRP-like cAMP-binding protein